MYNIAYYYLLQASLRTYDKEILQDLWKVRTGIHEVREIHRKQLEAENKYLDNGSSSLPGQRRRSKAEEPPPESPTSPFSPVSPPPIASHLSISAFNLKEPTSSDTVKKNDDAVLEGFFGTDNMNKVNAVLWQSVGMEDGKPTLGRKSQSTDRLSSARLPPLPEKRNRSKVNPISVSPKTSRVHASTPDMSSMRRKNQPVNDVCSEMQKLRMKLRETANQTVAEIEEKFSPKLNGFTLGPMIDLSLDHASAGSHSHQGSLDSSTSYVPMLAQRSTSTRHSRQHSLPVSVVAQTRPRSPTTIAAPSPPKSPSPSNLIGHHAHSKSTSPPSRSPTPPQRHSRQSSLGSSSSAGNFIPHPSGLITTCYQNQPYEVPMSSSSPRLPQQQSYHQHGAGHQAANGGSSRPHRKAPPPPTSRQYSPSSQSAGVIVGVMHNSSEQSRYMYGNRGSAAVHNAGSQRQSNLGSNSSGRFYSSNPNLLSAGTQDSTHYSTAVIKKRRSKQNIPSTSEAPVRHPNDYSASSRTYEPQDYDHLGSIGSTQHPSHSRHSELKNVSRGSNRPYSAGQFRSSHSTSPQHPHTHNELSHQTNSNHNQREVSLSSGETNFRQAPEQIQPYMSTGELRANMKQFQYIPFAEQSRIRQDIAENTWL